MIFNLKKGLPISLILVFVFVFGGCVAIDKGKGADFIDIQNHWAKNYIVGLATREMVAGYPDSTFKPENSVTRAEMVTLLGRVFEVAPAPMDIKPSFNDVAKSHWAFRYIESAIKERIVKGYPDKTFKPDQTINREEAVIMTLRALELGWKKGDSAKLNFLKDKSSISSWALEQVAYAYQDKVIPKEFTQGNEFKPKSLVKRGEAAALIYQAVTTHELEGTIVVKGSDTMVNLGGAWAELFMKKHPKVSISVTGGGSGIGIAALINNTTDLANASRAMKSSEIESAKKNGINPVAHIVALDGIAVVVHPLNPVSELTTEQLALIFMEKITNWKEVGGPDAKIVVLSREVNSGTHVFFKEHIIQAIDKKGEYGPNVLLMPSSQAIADEVAVNKNAIGYYGLGYLSSKQKAIAVKKDAKSKGVLSSPETVASETYPVSRPLYIYSKGEATGIIKKYLNFIYAPQGQKIVSDLELVALP